MELVFNGSRESLLEILKNLPIENRWIQRSGNDYSILTVNGEQTLIKGDIVKIEGSIIKIIRK